MAELLAPLVDGDVQPVATVLIDTFGTLGSIMSASDDRIRATCSAFSNTAERLIGARDLMIASLQETVVNTPVRSDDETLKRYFILKLRKLSTECLYAIFVDRDLGFLREELIAAGGLGTVSVCARTIVERAIDLRSTGVYLVHNHPSGCPDPSTDDIESTRSLTKLAKALDLEIHDHLIVAGNSIVSLRELGHL